LNRAWTPDNIQLISRSFPSYDVAIAGGGAAGLATAIFTRRLNPNRTVAVLDGVKKLGAKILVSGGGRCNVTNAVVTERDFWGGRPAIVRKVLRAFGVRETVAFFQEIGVTLHEEYDGKLFPDSNRARDVLDRLLKEADRVGATVLTDHRVDGVLLDGNVFTLVTGRGSMTTTRLVLATGGRSLPKSGSDGTGYDIARALGHTIVPTTPALAPLVLDNDLLHRELQGVSHDAELTVWIENRVATRLTGSLLWTHFGISGPVALNASRHWARAKLENKEVRLTLNFCPLSSFDALDTRVVDLATSRPRASIATLVSTFLPAAVASALMSQLGIDPETNASHLTRADRKRLIHGLMEWNLPISDTRGYNYAEATAGGIDLAEIDPATMESRVCPGLYLVGEVLDVDGRIGGFNFQWAWSSAQVAGRAIARTPQSLVPSP
jgi:predicted Rossmann fold flavoprotein